MHKHRHVSQIHGGSSRFFIRTVPIQFSLLKLQLCILVWHDWPVWLARIVPIPLQNTRICAKRRYAIAFSFKNRRNSSPFYTTHVKRSTSSFVILFFCLCFALAIENFHLFLLSATNWNNLYLSWSLSIKKYVFWSITFIYMIFIKYWFL